MQIKQEGSGLWKHGLLLTMLFGFTVMLVGGAYIYKTRAPIPENVVTDSGRVLFTSSDIQSGQELFRKRNLMNYGSVLGHGAYLGPDYTAEALHWMTEAMRADRSGGQYASLSIGQRGGIDAEVAAELRENRYNEATGTLTFTGGQTKAWDGIVARYTTCSRTDGRRVRCSPIPCFLRVKVEVTRSLAEKRRAKWRLSSHGPRGCPWPSGRKRRTLIPTTGLTMPPRATLRLPALCCGRERAPRC
jgi:hypothetical protein